MGVVLPFKKPGTIGPANPCNENNVGGGAIERPVLASVHAGGDQCAVLDAARPLINRCRDRFGFTVMQSGLPVEPAVLAKALLSLSRGLQLLEPEIGRRRSFRTYGVYFGQPRLRWFEDGYSGMSGLAVPNATEAAEFALFVASRLRADPPW